MHSVAVMAAETHAVIAAAVMKAGLSVFKNAWHETFAQESARRGYRD